MRISNFSQAQQQYYGRDQLRPLTAEQSGLQYRLTLPGNINIKSQDLTRTINIGDDKASTRVVLDNNSLIRTAIDYEPYGKSLSEVSNSAIFTGTYSWDAITGLYYSPTRLYDPISSRFLSRDPEQQTAATYSYAAGNPVSFIDRNGAQITIIIPDRNFQFPKKITDWPDDIPIEYSHSYKLPEPGRSLTADIPVFVRNVITMIDELYLSGADKIKLFPDAMEESVIGRLVSGKYLLNITPYSLTEISLQETGIKRSLIGLDNTALVFKLTSGKHFSPSNIGMHSPMLGLMHELIHAYLHDLYIEMEEMEEENLVTELTNQSALRLGEDYRPFYAGKPDATEYISTGPLSVKPDLAKQQPISNYLLRIIDRHQAKTSQAKVFWRPWE